MVLLCLSFLICCFHFIKAEQQVYSLIDIIEIARNRGTRIKIISNDYQSQIQQVKIYRSEAFPKIEFLSGIGYASQTLQSEISTGEDVEGLFDRISGTLLNWSLSLEQPVFRFGQIINSLRLASLSKKLTGKNSDLQRDQYYLQVIEQYIKAYVAQFEYNITQESVEQSRRNLQKTSIDFDLNHASKLDLLRAQAHLDGQKALLVSAESDRRLSVKELNIMIGLTDSTDYSLTIEDDDSFFIIPDTIHEQNPEIVIKKLELEFRENLRRNAWSAFFPSINLSGSVSNEFMAVDTSGFGEIIVTSSPVSSGGFAEIPVAVDFFNPDFINYSIGLQLKWNAFDGMRSIAQYRQAKAEEQKSRLELHQLELEIENDINEIKDRLVSIKNTISAYQLQFDAAKLALNQAEIDLKDGFIDMISYIDVLKEYQNAARSLDNAKLQNILLIAQLRIITGSGIFSD